jgi:hypothetical protein
VDVSTHGAARRRESSVGNLSRNLPELRAPTRCERLRIRLPSAPQSAKSSEHLHPTNALTILKVQAMRKPKSIMLWYPTNLEERQRGPFRSQRGGGGWGADTLNS